MTWREWKAWYRKLPGAVRWFVWLILLRPITDNFYYLKDISPFLSPLYIMGAGIPLLIAWSFLSGGLTVKRSSRVDLLFGLFSMLLCIQTFILFLTNLSVDMLGASIQYMTPAFLYFYLRRATSPEKNLDGILQTFVYSAVIPVLLIPYELFFNPRAFQQLSMSRGGGIHFTGGYADIMTYAIYLTGAFLILGYFMLQSMEDGKRLELSRRRLLFFLPLGIGGLFAIKHTASWAVFILLFGLFMIFALSNRRARPFVLILLMLGALAGQVIFEKQIAPLLRKEMRVIEGEAEVERSFNGRMTRWKKYMAVWDNMGFFARILGAPLSYIEGPNLNARGTGAEDPSSQVPVMVSGLMHSDFVRLLFLTGIGGLGFFILFLGRTLRQGTRFPAPRRFLIFSAVLLVGFYSISTNTLLYQPMMNYILAILAFSAAPPRRRMRKAAFPRSEVILREKEGERERRLGGGGNGN